MRPQRKEFGRFAARLAGLLAMGALLAGCATSKPLWFIATPGYVEAQITESETATRNEYDARLARLEAELEAQKAASAELAGLADLISEIERSNRELEDLAEEFERTLQAMPEDTVRYLVEVLQEHLENGDSR